MLARITITVGEGAPLVCDLRPGQAVVLGRHRTNTIVLQDRHASRRHAEVFAEGECWLIRDCGTLNGTKVNGARIVEPVPLEHGHEIGIGDTRLRFTFEPMENGLRPPLFTTSRPPALNPAAPKGKGTTGNGNVELSSEFQTILQVDELTALCSFMTASVEETSPRALIERALEVVHSHVWATATGFLSLDPEEPLPKLVLPDRANVDIHLSRQLTRQAQEEGRPIWLASQGESRSREDSLTSLTDALCVPLRAEGVPLGALHVYKCGSVFTERQLRFCEVLAGYLANSLHVLRSRRMLAAENSRLRVCAAAADEALIGTSPALEKVREHILRVAPRSCIVLIVGESGVGKELVATALHRQSPRDDGPLVAVNCAAIAASLSDAALFGHCAGSFTGATRSQPGFFEQADEGTLFLDEIGELSLECQAKLLRVLEGKGFRAVGATEDTLVDVRVVAATNRDLEQMVREGKFRQDLYFRLGIPIRVPPLREHAQDIPALASYFLDKLSHEYHRRLELTPAALARLQAFSWPGNVRQLRAVLESTVLMTDSNLLDAQGLILPETTLQEKRDMENDPPPTLNLVELEVWAIRQALNQTGFNVTAAAEILGIHRDTLGLKIKKYDLKRKDA